MADDIFSDDPAPTASPQANLEPSVASVGADGSTKVPMGADGIFSDQPETTAPPAPQATTLLSDKNIVVGHPMDMSHDQVNDAIQTQIYGRPRNDFHTDAPAIVPRVIDRFKNVLMGTGINAWASFDPAATEKGAIETGKAAVRGIENIGVGLAGLTKWFGEGVQHGEGTGIAEEPAWLQSIGKETAALSHSATDWLKKRQASGAEAPDPELFRGSFVSNPSWTRLAASVAQGVPSLGAAALVTLATANPIAGAGALGLMGAGEEYGSAREEGSSVGRSSVVAAASGIGNTLLMSLPLGHYLEGFKGDGLTPIAKGAAEFAGVSAVMTPFNNIVARIGGDKARPLFEGMTESILSGAMSGGLLGHFSPGRAIEIDGMIQDAHKAGVPSKDIDAARAEIANQMIQNPDTVKGVVDHAGVKNQAQEDIAQANDVLKDNPHLQEGAEAVYNDILGKLSKIERPAGISDADWSTHNELAAQMWAARTVTESVKRGTSVDEVYSRTAPKIESPEIPQEQQPTEQVPQLPEGSQSVYRAAQGAIYPAIEASSDPIIAQNPAFHKLRSDAEAVVNKYAQERQIPATPELGTRLFKEMHDSLGELMRAPADKKAEVKAALESKYPDLEAEFMALHNMEYVNKDKLFAKTMLRDYGSRRPKAGIDAETISPSEPSLTQQQFGDAAGVKGFGQGREGEQELFQSAYHGSPHEFDKFDISKIGSGEGNQAFGWGMYFAGKKEVAEFYRDNLSKGSPNNIKKLEEALAKAREILKTTNNDQLKTISWLVEKDKVAKLEEALKSEKAGHLYKVDIPEDHEYLDWDKDLAGQPKTIFQALKKLPKETKDLIAKKFDEVRYWTGQELYNALSGAFDESDEKASRALNAVGIPGLKFLDQGSRGDGKGTSNYVLFDDKAAKILEVNQDNLSGGNNPRGSTRFSPEKTVVRLMQNADASTFLHESAHVWLKDIHDYVTSGKANEKYLEDWKTLSDWLGVKEGAKTLNVAQHEQFARGFEAYVREGKAPSAELQSVFSRFKGWLTNLYKSAKVLNVKLSDNVRGVMDRMLSTPEPEIKPENKFVKNEPFEIKIGKDDKTTAKGIREQFAGIKNEQIVRGGQLADEIKRAVPNKTEREGMFWYKAANGDIDMLANALHEEKFAPYEEQIKAALTLSPKALETLKKIERYYTESGSVAQEVGTIKSVRENYQNRIYAPDKPTDFVKTETKSGIKQSTGHSKQRVFDTEFDAVRGGKTFATTDVADALSIHNEELARVNTSRKLADTMAAEGLGAWKKDVPDGWKKVGTLEKRTPLKNADGEPILGDDGNQLVAHSSFVAPEGIAKGLEAIADPNFAKKIEAVRGIQRYQGLVKTVDLAFSAFHHFTMAMQSLYQGGVRALLTLPVLNSRLASPEFAEMEQDFTRHTGMTAKVEGNQDILRKLVTDTPDTFSKITELPVVKQTLQLAEKSGEFLFGKVQRFLKVSDYGRKMANWVASHPDATNEQVKAAKVGFAKEINAVYGGLNWEAMGMTQSNLSLLRLGLLAPDWTISNIQLLKYAFGGGTEGSSSRASILTAAISGMVLTEGINKMLTGHFTDENDKGHKLEVEISPGVYVSFLRGGIGDISKYISMIYESGTAAGTMRFAQGKLAPFARTTIGLASDTKYNGREIYKKGEGHNLQNDYDVLKFILSSTLPVPLGVSNILEYKNDPEKTVHGGVAVLTGLGRYSKSRGGSSGMKT